MNLFSIATRKGKVRRGGEKKERERERQREQREKACPVVRLRRRPTKLACERKKIATVERERKKKASLLFCFQCPPSIPTPIKFTSQPHPLSQGWLSTPPWNSWGEEEPASSFVSPETARALARRKASERPEAAVVVDVDVGLPSSSVSAAPSPSPAPSPPPLKIEFWPFATEWD